MASGNAVRKQDKGGLRVAAASPPYRIIDRRNGYSAPSNRLVESATQTTERKPVAMLDYDSSRNISGLGRRTCMSIGRFLYWNYPLVKGAINEQAGLAVSSFIPQYWGGNKQWGDQAEAWLIEWHKIMDVRGAPYDYDSFLRHQIIHPLVDGDLGVLLTENEDGYPFIQQIPAHRISSVGDYQQVIVGGQYDGGRIIDGVVVSDTGSPIAYSILNDTRTEASFISARNMLLNWSPDFCDQVRGISALASCLFDLQDLKESRKFELQAQKAGASVTLIEKNASGMVDESKAVIQAGATHDSTGAKTQLTTQVLDGGTYRYFRAGSGEGLEAFRNDRPSESAMKFQESMLRDAFRGMGWDHYFSTEILQVGGAPLRVLVDKIDRVIRERQKWVEKVCRRIDGYAIAKAMKIGLLPWDDQWWMWKYQGPARLTADRKYESEAEIEEYAAGFVTMDEICGRRGQYWEDVQDQRIAEQKRLKEKSAAAGVEIDRVEIIKGKKEPKERKEEKPENGNASALAKALDQSVVVHVQPSVHIPAINVSVPHKPEKKKKLIVTYTPEGRMKTIEPVEE